MGLHMLTEAEFQAREQGSDLRNKHIPERLASIGYSYDEEELIAAIWLLAYQPVNEKGLRDLLIHHLFKTHQLPSTSAETSQEIAVKMYRAKDLLREDSPDCYAAVHYLKIVREWKIFATMVDRLMEEVSEVDWMTDDCYVPENRQASGEISMQPSSKRTSE